MIKSLQILAELKNPAWSVYLGDSTHKVFGMILSLRWMTVLSTETTMEQLKKAQGEQEEYAEG